MKIDLETERQEQESYACKPQQLISLVDAQTTVVVAGRGGGKTTNILAYKSFNLVHSMPGATINIYGETYQNMLLVTLKELFHGWTRLGFLQDVHYVVGKLPPKTWPKPYRAPLKPQYTIFTYTGAIFQILSQDVFNNGGSAQAMIADEARRLKKDDFDQVFLAMRDDTHFKGNPNYLSLTLTTDQPVSPHEQWIFDYEERMDNEQIDLIVDYQLVQNKLIQELYAKGTTESRKKKYLRPLINKYQAILNNLRKGSTFFHEFSTLDNLYGVGVEYIDNLYKTLEWPVFEISVLNKRNKRPPKLFYPNFNAEKHTDNNVDYADYEDFDFTYKKSITRSCRQDGDTDKRQELIISLDVGGHINVGLTGQLHNHIELYGHGKGYYDVLRFLKGMYVVPDLLISDLGEMWCKYYEPMLVRDVEFIFDKTDTADLPTGSAADQFMEVLRDKGWNVIENYVGDVAKPHARFNFINKLLSEKYDDTPRIRLNNINCEDCIIAIEKTELRIGKSGYEKEKKYERDPIRYKQHRVTHFPDAFDKMVYHKLIDHSPTTRQIAGMVTA